MVVDYWWLPQQCHERDLVGVRTGLWQLLILWGFRGLITELNNFIDRKLLPDVINVNQDRVKLG